MESKTHTRRYFSSSWNQIADGTANALDTTLGSVEGEPLTVKVETPQRKKRKRSSNSEDSLSVWFFNMLVFMHQSKL